MSPKPSASARTTAILARVLEALARDGLPIDLPEGLGLMLDFLEQRVDGGALPDDAPPALQRELGEAFRSFVLARRKRSRPASTASGPGAGKQPDGSPIG
jgi:hypothetical protein